MLKPCDTWAEPLSSYLDHEATPAECAAMEAHLRDCEGCRTLAELLRCDAQDTAATLQPRGAGDQFAAHVMARIAASTMQTSEDRYQEIPVQLPAKKKPSLLSRLLEWSVVVMLFAVIGAVMFPVFAKSREKARSNSCLNNARQIAIAFSMYIQDNEEQFPGYDWVKALAAYDLRVPTGHGMNILECPTGKQGKIAYVYNSDLAGKYLGDLKDPASTPLIWCTTNHNGSRVVAYVDGHVMVEPNRAQSASAPMSTSSPAPKRPSQPTIIPPTQNYGLAEKLQIAYTVAMALQSTDVLGAVEGAELAINRHGGFVLSSHYNRGTEPWQSVASITGRVPSEALGKLLVALDGLGIVTARQVDGEDLTAKHIENIETLGDLRGIQGRLGAIESRAKPGDALNAESKYGEASREATRTRVDEYGLKSRVRLVQVKVDITGIAPVVTPPAPQSLLATAAANALHGLRAFGIGLLAVLIPLLIWLPVWGPLLWLGLWLWRRYRRTTG